MRKQALIFTITLTILLVFGGTTLWLGPSRSLAADTPEGVAHENLAAWLNNLRGDDIRLYGFKNEQELLAATLGNPYQVFLLSPEAIQAYQPDQPVSHIISQEPWFVFPVLVNGQARGLLSVAQLDGQWQVVEFGDLSLSSQIVQLQRRFAGTSTTVRVVKFGPSQGTFALVEQDGRESLINLLSQPGLFNDLDQQRLTAYTPQDFMPKVKKGLDKLVAAKQEQQKFDEEKGLVEP